MNHAIDLLHEVEAAGVRLEVDGGEVYAEGPITDELVERLRAHKDELLAALIAARDGLSIANLPDPSTATTTFNTEAMEAIQCGQAVPVWSDLLGEWLYWVKGEVEREHLLAEGCKVPIYTLGELAVVVQHDPEDIKMLHTMKRTFNGTIEPSAGTKNAT